MNLFRLNVSLSLSLTPYSKVTLNTTSLTTVNMYYFYITRYAPSALSQFSALPLLWKCGNTAAEMIYFSNSDVGQDCSQPTPPPLPHPILQHPHPTLPEMHLCLSSFSSFNSLTSSNIHIPFFSFLGGPAFVFAFC